MADYNVNMKQWNGSSFDNVLPLAYNALNALKVGGKTYDEIVGFVNSLVGIGGYNARIATGSYVGNGKYGASNPTKINCDFYPVIVIIAYETTATPSSESKPYSVYYLRGMSKGDTLAPSSTFVTLTWTNKSVSFYSSSAGNQANYKGYTYHYFILGYDKTAEAAAE